MRARDQKAYMKEYNKAYRAKNREIILKQKREYYYENRERLLEEQKERKQKNRSEYLARRKASYERNKKQHSDFMREYRERNGSKISDLKREWRLNNIEHVRVKGLSRYHSKRAAGKFSVEEWLNLCAKYMFKCACCKQEKKLTIDHIKPLSKGGSNCIDNIQPLCSKCNGSKGTKEIKYEIPLAT